MEQVFTKLLAFTLVINFSVGLLLTVGHGVFDSNIQLEYKADPTDGNIDTLEDKIGAAPVQDSDNWGDKILDFFNLGVIQKTLNFIDSLLYGFVNMLVSIKILAKDLALILKALLSFVYIAGAVEMFTGKSIIGG